MSAESTPRRLVLHPSLIRPVLWGGADRRLVVPLWSLVVLLIFATPTHPLTLCLAVLLGFGGHYGLVRAAKADPFWFDVYLRSLRYQDEYPAHSSVRAAAGRTLPSLPQTGGIPVWSEHTEAPNGLDDLVNYADLIAPGVMRLKDGALLTAWHYAGPDLDLAAAEEMERLSAQVNAAFLRCGTGWMLHLDVLRRATTRYFPPGAFPDPTSAVIDEERRRRSTVDPHYESIQAFALTYLPPTDLEYDLAGLLYEGPAQHAARQDLVLESFAQVVHEIEDLLGSVLRIARMNDEELLTYLHCCVTGEDRPVTVPPVAVDLDTLIADQDVVGGFRPQIGERHVRAISIDGYPLLTEPGAQAFLHELSMAYRWNIRFVFLDRVDAEALIATKQKHWWQQRKTLSAKAGEMAAGASAHLDQANAVQMAEDANEAAAEAASGTVLYGLYTMTVIVQDEDEGRVEMKARDVQKQIQRCGFGARIERPNSLEAIVGSFAGHGYQNVRRVPMHTMNMADLLPLTTVWAGLASNPNSYFPRHSSPLMLTATAGQTPFRVNLDVHDVGHSWILGPVGSGKSTLLAMLMAQWWRYPQAQIFAFDKGYSAFTLCQACGGDVYDIGNDERVAFAPLTRVDDAFEREWALGWLEELSFLQGVHVNPEQRAALWRALTLMGARDHNRTLTGLCTDLQDHTLRDGLAHYTLSGGAGALLDAEADSLQSSRFMVFEMEHLLSRGDQDLVAVMLYLFHVIDQRCRQGFPTLIPIDEAWLMMLRSRFATKVEEWLRTKRRENARVLFVSQSLADVERSPQRHILVESCQTKFFLPNAEAMTTQSAELYRALGLNDKQIALLATAIPKKQYLYISPYGRRLFDLRLGPVALAFTGVSDRAELRRVREVMRQYGDEWSYHWLRERGCPREAEWWWRWQDSRGVLEQEDHYADLWQDLERNRRTHPVLSERAHDGARPV